MPHSNLARVIASVAKGLRETHNDQPVCLCPRFTGQPGPIQVVDDIVHKLNQLGLAQEVSKYAIKVDVACSKVLQQLQCERYRSKIRSIICFTFLKTGSHHPELVTH